MVGVNDAYQDGGVKTFGRDELKNIIKTAGFKKIEEYLPFPDYKLPSLLITPEGHENHSQIVYPLISDTCFKEAQRPKSYTFSLEQASKIIWKNNLGAELSNSFLMIVSDEGEEFNNDNILAWYYSDVRLNGDNKKISFTIDDGDFHANSFKLNGDVISSEKYHQGESLWLALAKITNKNGWMCQEVSDWALQWIDIILTDCGEKNNIRWDLELPGKYLDATPFNIICNKVDNHIFDLDLEADKPLLLSQLVFRGLHNSLLRLTSIAPTDDLADYNIYNLTRRVVLSIFPFASNASFEHLLIEEMELISSHINVDKNDLAERYKNSFFTVRHSLDYLANELANAHALNAVIQQDLKNRIDYINAIHSTRAWKLASALKRVINRFKK
jgi:hypothetical protein